jgi:hypothetical protein
MPTLPRSKPRRRKPLGPPLERTEAQLEELSQITPKDVEAARVFMAANAPVVAKLLDAQLVEPSEEADDTP